MSEQEADWAILVYISADRVLTNFAVESLKQLKKAAGDRIIALAQMQGTVEKVARRYVFRGVDKRAAEKAARQAPGAEKSPKADPNASIEFDRQKKIKPRPSPGGIANPDNLTQFVKWAYTNFKAKRYCLFLWGHGYELLLNTDKTLTANNATSNGNHRQARGNAAVGRNYLAPRSLKKALKDAGKALDIIGVDACSLSLLELASELRGHGEFMIASQGDVPDGSFPYERLLQTLTREMNERGSDRLDPKAISAAIPAIYREAYQDYVLGFQTGISELTLTSIQLNNMNKIERALKQLATTLLSFAFDASVSAKVIEAREAARDFALGLFVDLRDFCHELAERIPEGGIKAACDHVTAAIDGRKVEDCILENVTRGIECARCHGLSVYFPYLKEKEVSRTEQLLVSGETTMEDQVRMLVKGGTNNFLKARSVQISQIEGDFESLEQFEQATHWGEFIKHGWSVMMAAKESKKLDQLYSGQQCAENLLSLVGGQGGDRASSAAAGKR